MKVGFQDALRGRPAPGVAWREGDPAPENQPTDNFAPGNDGRPPRKGTAAKVLAYGVLATTGLGILAGAATNVLASVPICQTQQTVGWENGGLCVSPELGTGASGVWRTIRGVGYAGRTASQRNQLIQPERPTTRELDNDVDVATWNLHHARTPNNAGSRRVLDEQLRELAQENPDVVLLQEVDPSDVRHIVDTLGMKGLYAQTTWIQGNLMLVHPDLTVEADQVVPIAGVEPGESVLTTLVEWARAQGKQEEPRNMQLAQVRTPEGRSFMIWNTHYPTGSYTPEQHRVASLTIDRVLEEVGQKNIPVIGGGDMNARNPNHPVIAPILEQGYQGLQDRIDWLFGSEGTRIEDFRSERPTDENGTLLSDHPLVSGRVPLSR